MAETESDGDDDTDGEDADDKTDEKEVPMIGFNRSWSLSSA